LKSGLKSGLKFGNQFEINFKTTFLQSFLKSIIGFLKSSNGNQCQNRMQADHCLFISFSDSQSSNSCLEQFLVQISSLTLESLAVTTSKDQFQQTNDDHSILSHFDHVMSEKKMHEVLLLSDVVSQLAKNQNVTSIIDVGSGKAYLTQFLGAMQNQLCILAIDASSGNLKGAQKRSAILEVFKIVNC
jgi:hypothetical protein